MNISKLDAAKRQLDTAINLFFKEGEPTSIHTLTAASHQLLMDLSKLEDKQSIFKNASLGIIKADKQAEYLAMINEAENFFKHADRDPKELLEFNPEQTKFLMLDAVEMYMQLTNEKPEDMSIFRVWFLLQYPNIVSQNTIQGIANQGLITNMQSMRSLSKSEYYKRMKDALMSNGQ